MGAWLLRASSRAVRRIWRILLSGWTWHARPQEYRAGVPYRLQTSTLAILRSKRRIYIGREKSWAGILRRAGAVGIESNLVKNHGVSSAANGREVESGGTACPSDRALRDNILADVEQRNSGIVRNVRGRQSRVLGADNRVRNRVESSAITTKVTQRVSLAAAQEPGSAMDYSRALNLARKRSHVRGLSKRWIEAHAGRHEHANTI